MVNSERNESFENAVFERLFLFPIEKLGLLKKRTAMYDANANEQNF